MADDKYPNTITKQVGNASVRLSAPPWQQSVVEEEPETTIGQKPKLASVEQVQACYEGLAFLVEKYRLAWVKVSRRAGYQENTHLRLRHNEKELPTSLLQAYASVFGLSTNELSLIRKGSPIFKKRKRKIEKRISEQDLVNARAKKTNEEETET